MVDFCPRPRSNDEYSHTESLDYTVVFEDVNGDGYEDVVATWVNESATVECDPAESSDERTTGKEIYLYDPRRKQYIESEDSEHEQSTGCA